MSTTNQKEITKPRTLDVLGGLLLMVALPPLTYYMWLCVNNFGGALVAPTVNLLLRIPAPTVTSVVLYGCWFLLQVILQIAAPGKVHEGVPLSDGTCLKYKMNGWFSFWFTLGLVLLVVGLGWIPSTILYDQFGPLLTTVNTFAFGFSVFLYLHGKASKRPERTTGNVIYDYFMGSALNPRLGRFDLKLFCEARPGLILWILIDLSLAAKQYELWGTVTTPMILVNAFQFLYIADYYYHEEAILTTWDIKHENFGWMLCWGDLVWVPFTYTLQAYYLINHTHELSVLATVALVALNMLGYVIFRGANWQKHKFRKNPQTLVWGKPLEYIRTSHGTLLLTSGWWGITRHMNYLGDLLMALAWCLPTGFEHPLPYFYIVYFTILLVHREWRDNAMCRDKYGKDWEAYCRKVPWRIVPGIY
jgi:protein-S-isoprenylcysteine O-methyltransferase Ste14